MKARRKAQRNKMPEIYHWTINDVARLIRYREISPFEVKGYR